MLANRRTFLAYIRTAVAFIAGGVALGLVSSAAAMPLRRVAAVVLVVGGALLAVVSLLEWRAVERALAADERLPSSRLALLVTAITLIAAGLVLVEIGADTA